jgi:hypothetical protein
MNSQSVKSFDGVEIGYDISTSVEHSSIKDDKTTLVFVHGWSCNRTN